MTLNSTPSYDPPFKTRIQAMRYDHKLCSSCKAELLHYGKDAANYCRICYPVSRKMTGELNYAKVGAL